MSHHLLTCRLPLSFICSRHLSLLSSPLSSSLSLSWHSCKRTPPLALSTRCSSEREPHPRYSTFLSPSSPKPPTEASSPSPSSSSSSSSSSSLSPSSSSPSTTPLVNSYERRRVRFWCRLVAVAFIGGYSIAWYIEKQRAIQTALQQSINISEDEIMDLMARVRLNVDDIVTLYQKCMRANPQGLFTLNQFGALVETVCTDARQRRQRLRAEKAAACAVVSVDSTDAAALNTNKSSSALASTETDKPIYWDDRELAEEKYKAEAAELMTRESLTVEEQTRLQYLRANILRRDHFQWFEVLPLFRYTNAIAGTQLYDLRDLIIGVCQLSYDHRDWISVVDLMKKEDRWKEKRVYRAEEKMQLCYDPARKLELAWRITDEQRTGRLTYTQMTKLIARMLQTGHFTISSVLHPCSLAPPHFALLTPAHITRLLFTRVCMQRQQKQYLPPSEQSPELDRAQQDLAVFWRQPVTSVRCSTVCPSQETTKNQSSRTAALEPKFPTRAQLAAKSPLHSIINFSLEPSPDNCIDAECVSEPVDENATMSYGEFLAACKSLSTTGEVVLWYLLPRNIATGERAGPIRSRRLRLQELIRLSLAAPFDTNGQSSWWTIV